MRGFPSPPTMMEATLLGLTGEDKGTLPATGIGLVSRVILRWRREDEGSKIFITHIILYMYMYIYMFLNER